MSCSVPDTQRYHTDYDVVLLFVFWYCHKRGREVRLEKERTVDSNGRIVELQDDPMLVSAETTNDQSTRSGARAALNNMSNPSEQPAQAFENVAHERQ